MKRHPMDTVSLVFALLFSAAVAWWGAATISHDPLHVPAAWLGAGTLLIVGLVGLISALRPQRHATPDAPMTVAPEPPAALGPEHDPYSDPYFGVATLPRTDVLDAEAIAAAYREAGFEDPETMAALYTQTKVEEARAAEPDAFPTDELPAADSAPTVVTGHAGTGTEPADDVTKQDFAVEPEDTVSAPKAADEKKPEGS